MRWHLVLLLCNILKILISEHEEQGEQVENKALFTGTGYSCAQMFTYPSRIYDFMAVSENMSDKTE